MTGDLERRVEERSAELAAANAALAAASERYHFLADAMPVIVWMSRADGNLDYFNRCWYDYTGMTFEQNRGWGWTQVVHPDDRESYVERWTHSYTTGEEFAIECRFRRASDGTYRWHVGRAVPRRNAAGTIVQWVGTCTDVDDYKRAVEGMEVANKELEAFAYSVSHDLRAPVRAIDGFSRILEKEHASTLAPEALRFLHRIRSNTEKMGKLIDDLLAFSRLGRQAVRPREVNAARVVSEVWEDLSEERQGRRVEWVLNDLPCCFADATLLGQVFGNLLDNALKYSRSRDPATVEVGGHVVAETDEVVYWVRDNGVGFDVRYADKLFGVFQRLVRAEDFEGTGVGLALVQRIVHRFGGRVWAESQLGEGATFSFALPRNEKGVRSATSEVTEVDEDIGR